MEMRIATGGRLVGKRISRTGIRGLLGAASRIVVDEKSTGEVISHEKIDDWDE